MINRSILLSCFFIINAPSFLQASSAPSTTRNAVFNSNPDKQALIKKIILYSSFDLVLKIDTQDELYILADLIKPSRATIALLLEEIIKTYTNDNKTQPNEIFATNLVRALYCRSCSQEEIDDSKKIGKRIVRIVHTDKGHNTNNGSKLSSEITEYLMNNRCGDSLNSLLAEKEKLIANAQNILMTNNLYKIETYRVMELSAKQIGYSVGTKFMNKIIPSQDPETEKVLRCAFVNQARINTLNAEYILTDYLTHSRMNHVA